MSGWLIGHLSVAAACIAIIYNSFRIAHSGVRYFYQHMRDSERNQLFIEDMATVQVPYIHRTLNALASARGIEIDDPPPINWQRINGSPSRHAK